MSRLNTVTGIVGANKNSNCGGLVGRIVPNHSVAFDAVCIHRHCPNCGVQSERLKKLKEIGVKNV